jgi:hypothetical protein
VGLSKSLNAACWCKHFGLTVSGKPGATLRACRSGGGAMGKKAKSPGRQCDDSGNRSRMKSSLNSGSDQSDDHVARHWWWRRASSDNSGVNGFTQPRSLQLNRRLPAGQPEQKSLAELRCRELNQSTAGEGLLRRVLAGNRRDTAFADAVVPEPDEIRHIALELRTPLMDLLDYSGFRTNGFGDTAGSSIALPDCPEIDDENAARNSSTEIGPGPLPFPLKIAKLLSSFP